MYGSAHKTTYIRKSSRFRGKCEVKDSEWGGWGVMLGAGEGLAKAREELTMAKLSS